MPGCHRGNFPDFANAAGARDIRLDEIYRAADDEIFKAIAHVQVFTDGDGSFTSLSKNSVPLDVFDKKWLFKPISAAIRKSIGSLESHLQGVALVGVGHHHKVFPQFLADGVQALQPPSPGQGEVGAEGAVFGYPAEAGPSLPRGAVEPKIDYAFAVKLAKDFYVVLYRISEKILDLSGQGAQLKKKSFSGSSMTPSS